MRPGGPVRRGLDLDDGDRRDRAGMLHTDNSTGDADGRTALPAITT